MTPVQSNLTHLEYGTHTNTDTASQILSAPSILRVFLSTKSHAATVVIVVVVVVRWGCISPKTCACATHTVHGNHGVGVNLDAAA